MEVLESWESFKNIDGKLKFHHISAVVQLTDPYFLIAWPDRFSAPTDLSSACSVQKLDTNRGPDIKPTWTLVSQSVSYYLKTPALAVYASQGLEARMLREIETCEILRQHPHPNLATYYGCHNESGKATGLYFKQYQTTLSDEVNPEHLSKEAFTLTRRPRVTSDILHVINDLLDGVQNLHSLGLVHNDITPANIMLDESRRLVLIDFDSRRHEGDSISDTKVRRTYGWYDPKVDTSMKQSPPIWARKMPMMSVLCSCETR